MLIKQRCMNKHVNVHLKKVIKTEESSVLTTLTKKLVSSLELVKPIKTKVEKPLKNLKNLLITLQNVF